MLTLAGINLVIMVNVAVVVETVFAWPGIGRLLYEGITFRDFQKQTPAEQRYLVFVLTPGEKRAVTLVDLGSAETVDKAVAAYLKAMSSAREGYVPNRRKLDQEAGELYRLLVLPLEGQLAGRRHLFVSPDGSLELVPFEVLRSQKGEYLIGSYQISYVAAGRDILRFERKESASARPAEAVILADPNYDLGLKSTDPGLVELTASPARGAFLTSFSRLPDTRLEADAIENILTQRMRITVRDFQGEKAVESALRAVDSPKILHLATHGYFFGKDDAKPGADGAETSPVTLKDDPMFRSGLALAGVNLSLREGKDDGVVSAEKLMGLRLGGTDLVVLSACETGVGEVLNGEGVFGLKRAFILSGARAVILSLWSVPSAETRELMTSFYNLMADGKSKVEALREAKLEMAKERPNPFYWGAFVLVGDPQ